MVVKETSTPQQKLSSLFNQLDSQIRDLPNVLFENNYSRFPSEKGFVFIECQVEGRYAFHIVTSKDSKGHSEAECIFSYWDEHQVYHYFNTPENIQAVEEKIKSLVS